MNKGLPLLKPSLECWEGNKSGLLYKETDTVKDDAGGVNTLGRLYGLIVGAHIKLHSLTYKYTHTHTLLTLHLGAVSLPGISMSL